MKKIKKYIIIVICLIIILLIATIGLRKNNSGNQLFISEDIQESEDDREYDDSIQISIQAD